MLMATRIRQSGWEMYSLTNFWIVSTHSYGLVTKTMGSCLIRIGNYSRKVDKSNVDQTWS